MQVKKVVAMAIVFVIVAFIFHTISAFLTMDYYVNPEYFPLWSEIMMPEGGAPGLEFTLTSLGFNFIVGIIFGAFFLFVKGILPGKTNTKKGMFFGVLLFLLFSVPNTLSSILILSVPLTLLLIWAFTGLVISIISGIIFTKIGK